MNADINVRGCSVHIQRAGSGEPLLFLHGAQGLAGWDRGLEALAKQFDVIAPDHPGFGLSGNTETVDDLSDLAFFYLNVLDELDLKDVHVVGQCVGGWLAMEMAIRSTSRMKTLTLVNSAGIRLKGVHRADMFICTQDELMQLLFAGNSSADWLQQWKASPALEDAYERNTFAAAKFTWQPRLCSLKLDRWLHRIDVPTHIIWGENAKVIPPAYGAALKGLIPCATLATLPGCGHLAHYEQPEALASEVTKFVRRAVQ
jgi:pimeloyl-ACP methyl ester carboxylesterase